MSPAALGGVGQEQLNNNFPPQKNLGEAQAGGPRRKVLRTSYGASKKENFCLPRSILSEAKDCYGAHLLKRLVLASADFSEPWAGLSPVGRQSKVSVRILGEIGSDFNQKAPQNFLWTHLSTEVLHG